MSRSADEGATVRSVRARWAARTGRRSGRALLAAGVLLGPLSSCTPRLTIPEGVIFGQAIGITAWVTEPHEQIRVRWAGRLMQEDSDIPPEGSTVTQATDSTALMALDELPQPILFDDSAVLRPGLWSFTVTFTPVAGGVEGAPLSVTCSQTISSISAGPNRQSRVELAFFEGVGSCSCPADRCQFQTDHDVAIQALRLAPDPPVADGNVQVFVDVVNRGSSSEGTLHVTLEGTGGPSLQADIPAPPPDTAQVATAAFQWNTAGLSGAYFLTARVAEVLGERGTNPDGGTIDNTANNRWPGTAITLYPDVDDDNVADGADNCPTVTNPAQGDADGDGVGDECELRIRAFEPGCPTVQPCALLPSTGGVVCAAFQQSAAGCVIVLGERFRNISAIGVGGTNVPRFGTCDENTLVFEHVAGASGPIQVTSSSEGSAASAAALCPPTPATCPGLTIGDFAPRAAAPLATVIVFGCGFEAGTQVTLAGITTPALVLTPTALAFQVPYGASSGLLTVTTPQGSATSGMVLTVP